MLQSGLEKKRTHAGFSDPEINEIIEKSLKLQGLNSVELIEIASIFFIFDSLGRRRRAPFGRPSTSPLGKDSQGLNTDGMSPAVSRSKAAAICLIVSQFKLRFDLDTGKFKLFKRVFSVQSNTWQNLLWCPFPLRFKSIKDAAQGIFL